ncbi:hypothetical protein AB4289_21900 [Vibrio cyclitrophicus]|uniref:hypothetical protein n=1 Tax=Vibrio cyclitrophicus TaxID=47951 RepID=UPI000C8458A9|nr:hypothetical protein [Vibrio cyclitrophicus]PME11291.1 hypothetical protein BCV43_20450 [Vibrio cyclitrophicus]
MSVRTQDSLTLDEKLIIRSVADLVVNRPELAKLVLNNGTLSVHITNKLDSVVEVLNGFDNFDDVEGFLQTLKDTTQAMNDIEVRVIFDSSLKDKQEKTDFV